jgi:RHS repeat-associated protein
VVYGDNSYRYDDDGYLMEKVTPDGSTTYAYGTMGQLLSVTTPEHNVTYAHNALNQRVAKLVDGEVVEKYLWADLTTLLAVYNGSDNLVQRFAYADQRMPVAMTMGATKYYLHYDQVGSLRAVSDTNGTIAKEVLYDTFGNVLTDSNSSLRVPFGFAGGLYDVDTQLTRFGYRDYDAYTGKWTAKDPIGFAGGDSNLYGYVLQDPVNLVDPEGLADIPLLYNDPTYTFYDSLPWNNPSNYISISAHGARGTYRSGSHIGGYGYNDMKELINMIKNLNKYKNNPKMPIELQACEVGSTDIPQILANSLGRTVKAYPGYYRPLFPLFSSAPLFFYPNQNGGKTW